MKNGFSGIGLVSPKTDANIGSALRAATCYDAAFLAIERQRANVRTCTDTHKTYRKKPVFRVEDLRTVIPFDCVPVAVDLVDDAENLVDFIHPKRAFYIFGPEDGTLGKKHLDWCAKKVYVPTALCMNLAATVNVILYDRIAKELRK